MYTNTMNENEIFDEGDFAFIQKTGEDGQKVILGGGYKVESYFLQNDISPMTTINGPISNDTMLNGGKKPSISSPFENLAVPAGLFYINQRVPKCKADHDDEHYYKEHVHAPDDLIDKLFALVEVDKKRKRKTHKHRDKLTKKRTRRH